MIRFGLFELDFFLTEEHVGATGSASALKVILLKGKLKTNGGKSMNEKFEIVNVSLTEKSVK